jgi:hypothetical protein
LKLFYAYKITFYLCSKEKKILLKKFGFTHSKSIFKFQQKNAKKKEKLVLGKKMFIYRLNINYQISYVKIKIWHNS